MGKTLRVWAWLTCALGLAAGCTGPMTSREMAELKQSEWYQTAVARVNDEENSLPIRIAGYNDAVIVGVVAEDVARPPEGVVTSIRLENVKEMASQFSIYDGPTRPEPMASAEDFPEDGVFHRGSIWAFDMSANAKGHWFLYARKLIRPAPSDSGS